MLRLASALRRLARPWVVGQGSYSRARVHAGGTEMRRAIGEMCPGWLFIAVLMVCDESRKVDSVARMSAATGAMNGTAGGASRTSVLVTRSRTLSTTSHRTVRLPIAIGKSCDGGNAVKSWPRRPERRRPCEARKF